MPLSTTEKRESQPASGCALASDGRPCVAQRVCPMPVVAGERRRVGSRGRAGRGPGGVPDAGGGGRAVEARALLQHAQVADRAHDLELVSVNERDAGGIVAAVLGALEAADQVRLADAPAG